MTWMHQHDVARWGERTMRMMRTVHEAARIVRTQYHMETSDECLTRPQRFLVMVLLHEGSQSVQDLARHMGLSNSTVSGIIDRLEAKGMVVRKRREDDRRSVIVELSDTQARDIKTCHSAIDKRIDDFVQSLSDTELDAFCDVVDKFSAFMRKEESTE